MTAIERALLSRLDRAAYLGRELADKVCASQLPRRLRIEPIVMRWSAVTMSGNAMRGLMARMILTLSVQLANSWLKRWIEANSPAKDVAADPSRKRS
jgi:hypothetical protein